MELNSLSDQIELLYIKLDDPDYETEAQQRKLKIKISDLTEDLDDLMAEHKKVMKKHNLKMGLDQEPGDISISDASAADEAYASNNRWDMHKGKV